MNGYFATAALLTFLVGLAHSVVGEMLIFRRMRQGTWIPAHGARLLGEGHVRILWASWHVLTVFGWAFAAILLWLAMPGAPAHALIEQAIVGAMLLGAVLVFVGTIARHPGWIGLLGVALLVWFGRSG